MPSVNPNEISREFGSLLQYYRERTHDPENGGYLTQVRLAQIAACGFSGTMVGHWETGRRAIGHRDRFILLALLAVLHEYGGIQTLDEANQLLETGLYSQLTASEIRQLDVDWLVEEAKTPEPTAASPSPLTIILSPHTISEHSNTFSVGQRPIATRVRVGPAW